MLLVSVLLLPGLTALPSGAAPSAATAASSAALADQTGKVRGEILGPGGSQPDVRLTWFTEDYEFLGSRRTPGGAYSLTLPVGSYRLQFTDVRPTYDVKRFQPTDVAVEVTAAQTTTKTVRMTPGAAIGGTVRAGAKVAKGARVVVALADERTFSTTADKRGRYALGGIPSGKGYSVFTYDRARTWVAKSTYLRKLVAGTYTAVSPTLRTAGGTLLVDLYTGDGAYDGDPVSVTAVSRTTGQFWVARTRNGSVTFQGLFPGRYRLVVPGLDDYLPAEVNPAVRVRSKRTAFTDATLAVRGASVTGRVVDANRRAATLGRASVRLLDADGDVLDTTTAATDGTFLLDGQLTTQSGLTVVVGPDPNNPYLGQGTSYCRYAEATTAPFGVTTGDQTVLGDVALPHLPDAQQDGEQCHTPAPTPRETP